MSRRRFARSLHDEPLRRLLHEAQQLHEQESEPAPAGLVVGATDDRAEHEADAVAERVLGRLGASLDSQDSHGHHDHDGHDHAPAVRRTPAAPAIGAAGGALDAGSSGAIERARGTGSALPVAVRREMEAGFGHSLADVRIHTDARAAELSRGMAARAFTTGRDIFFDKGEFAPDTPDGKRVLAHEIAHTRQQPGVRRKLRGTAQALRDQGEVDGDGGKSSGVLRKLTGKLTNWDKIVVTVREYEAREAALLAGGKNPDPTALMAAKPKLLRLLMKAQGYVQEWRTANHQDEQDDLAQQKRQKINKRTQQRFEQNVGTDPRTKAARRQAVSMVERRLGHEINLLSSKDGSGWLASLGLSAQQATGTGKTNAGQKNQVAEIHYQTEGGDLSGYFKADHGFNAGLEGHEAEIGIRQADPNYGARTVALYRLDQLFDAQVTARAEFAVHTDQNGKSQLGTVLETAKGTAGTEVAWGRQNDRAEGTLSLDDPVLRRGLNKLQLLDAISGQLDRHTGNFHVSSDGKGNVTGVTGIDLDMAFGRDMTTTKGPDRAHNYKGLPDVIDKAMGERILQVKDTDIRDALAGLLAPAEIAATVSRFLEVQRAVRAAKQSGRLEDTWSANGAKGTGVTWQDTAMNGHKARKGYRDELLDNWRWALEKSLAESLPADIRAVLRGHGTWTELPTEVEDEIIKANKFDSREMFQDEVHYNSPLIIAIATVMLDNDLSNSRLEAVTTAAIEAMLDELDADKLAVRVIENDVDSRALSAQIRDGMQRALPGLMRRFG